MSTDSRPSSGDGQADAPTRATLSKLAAFGPVAWINLDRAPDRRAHMEALFAAHRIRNVRIPAIDAQTSEVEDNLVGGVPRTEQRGELACALSHLRAIRWFLEQSAFDRIVICEDDLSFETVPHWPFSFARVLRELPYDWDVLQCSVTRLDDPLWVCLHERLPGDYCAAAYVLTRHHARKLGRLHMVGSKYRLENCHRYPSSENLVFRSGKTYTLPLLTYRLDFQSGIHQDHVDRFHAPSVDVVRRFWTEAAAEAGAETILNLRSPGPPARP